MTRPQPADAELIVGARRRLVWNAQARVTRAQHGQVIASQGSLELEWEFKFAGACS